MSDHLTDAFTSSPTVPATADAVGVSAPRKNWYVGIVSNGRELLVSDRLAHDSDLGFESYVPVQTEEREWSRGRKHIHHSILFRAKVFIHVTDSERRDILKQHVGVLRFMTNIAGKPNEFGLRPLAIIPDSQIQALRLMIDASPEPVTVTEDFFPRGTAVRVINGPLKGLEGIIGRDSVPPFTTLYVTLNLLGSASTQIDVADVEKIEASC